MRQKASELGLDGGKLIAASTARAERVEGVLDRGRAGIAAVFSQTLEMLTNIRRADDPLVDRGMARLSKSSTDLRTQLAVASAVRILSEREAAFEPGKVVKTALDLQLSEVTVERVEKRVDRLVGTGQLVLGAPRDDGTVTMSTTREALATENGILATVERGRGQVRPMVSPGEVVDRIVSATDRPLNAGQIASATTIASSPDRTSRCKASRVRASRPCSPRSPRSRVTRP